MNQPKYTHCIECGEPFTEANVHTRDGVLETQISGMCEDCFDALFEGYEEDETCEDDCYTDDEAAF